MQLRSRPDVAVMELGMNHAERSARWSAIAEPDVRVWTNVGDAHLGFFASADAIADAKAEILERRRQPTTLLVCNADDPRVMARARGFAGRVLTFGDAEQARRCGRSDVEDRGVDGMRARVATPAGDAAMDDAAARTRQPVERAGGDRRGARVSACRSTTIAAGGRRLRPADRRGAVAPLRGGITLIDDSYNSSPAALAPCARGGGARDAGGAKGRRARRDARARRSRRGLHRQCGRAAADAGARSAVRRRRRGGARAGRRRRRRRDAGLVRRLLREERRGRAGGRAEARAGDLVLVKGSRGTRTDVVVDRLVAELG